MDQPLPMRKTWTYLIALSLGVTAVTGCGNLKAIHGYTSASVDGLSAYNNLDYSFQQSCLDRCYLTALRSFSIQRDTTCDCQLYEKADSVTQLIYNAVASYLTELNALSSNDLTTYNLDALQTAIVYEDFAPLHIDDQQVNAYMAISRLLLHTTDLHQLKKLREFIGQANEPLQVLIKKLQFILQQNLNNELNFEKESAYAYYKDMSMDNSLSAYEKSKLVQDYHQRLSVIRVKQQKIDTWSQLLAQIALGHQQIFDHRHELSAKKVQAAIHQYAINIQGLEAAFNHLK